MPVIGWIFIAVAVGMVLSSLFLLRDTAHTMPLSERRKEKIRERQAELEAEEQVDEKADDDKL